MDYDLSTAFQRIEDELISSMMRNLDRHRAEETAEGFQWSQWQTEQLAALNDYSQANQKKFSKRYFSTLNSKIGDALQDSYSGGETTQEAAILQAIRDGSSAKRQTDALGGSFFRTNERKLNALVKATTDDVAQAETAVLRRANDAYRKIIYNAQVYANTGAGTYEQAVDMATKDFLAAGIQCVEYSNGARHTLADYADMAIKTASKRAYLQGEGDKRQEWGVTTVIVNKRGNACPKCAKFCGKVFIDDVWSGGKRSDGNYPLLSAAITQGLYHPRCKDSHSTWFPELHQDATPYTKEEIARLERNEQAEQRQQYAQRQAEKYRRMEKYSLDPDNQRKYGNLAEQWEQETLSRKMQEVISVCNEMEYPYGVTLGYQAQNVKTAIVTAPDITFAYNAKTDTLELNPANPKFADFDFTETVLHELAHRYDVLAVHSWESAEFAAALTESKKYVINNLDAVKKLVQETQDNGFMQDILEILSDKKLNTYAGHGTLTEMAQKMELFANLSSVKARNDPAYDLLTKYFPQLTKTFEHLFEGA